jgi:hypothetical protein
MTCFYMNLAIARLLRYPVTVSGLGLLVAFAASAFSGIAAGISPSFKATQIHPVDIIREILGGIMSQHKKIERKKELDRKRRRREKNLKLRAKEAKGKSR